ncbi:hypothetical protein HYU17_01465 [Candidatus Woesearchaeota archaeon]|nr:hypothetical protein [Candidatus Woesearchaeota archaeon]
MENDLTTRCEIIEWKFSGAEIGELFLKVKVGSQDLTMDCFISGDTLYALAIDRLYEAGDSVKVQFALLAYHRTLTKSEDTAKNIALDSKSKEGSNEYLIRGQVVRVYPHESKFMAQDYQRLVIDCGVNICTTAPLSYAVKAGDYMQMEGRLDAHIVGKVK